MNPRKNIFGLAQRDALAAYFATYDAYVEVLQKERKEKETMSEFWAIATFNDIQNINEYPR